MERRDIPITSMNEDVFGVDKHVKSLCQFIRNNETPITIALQGEWGSGKTSFMKMMESELCDRTKPATERYDSIWLNTWELFLENNYEAAVKKLIFSLVMQMEEHFERYQKSARAEKRKKILKEYLKNISSFALESFNLKNQITENLLDDIWEDDL